MIYLCSYDAALLESLSRFTQHVTTGGAKCLILTPAGFSVYMLFSAYSVVWYVITLMFKI